MMNRDGRLVFERCITQAGKQLELELANHDIHDRVNHLQIIILISRAGMDMKMNLGIGVVEKNQLTMQVLRLD